jgi:hypothetical protein
MFATRIALLDMKGSVCLIALLKLISADAPVAAEESKFAPNTETLVRKVSFACKRISDLDRLIQLDGQGAFTSGMQLYQYSKRHNCVGLSTNRRVRVIAVQDDYVCVYDSREAHAAGRIRTVSLGKGTSRIASDWPTQPQVLPPGTKHLILTPRWS